MNREELVKLLNDLMHNPGYISASTKADVLISYCVSKGKDPTQSVKFVQLLLTNSITLHSFFLEALETLKKDYNIVLLYSKINNEVLGSRQILAIY